MHAGTVRTRAPHQKRSVIRRRPEAFCRLGDEDKVKLFRFRRVSRVNLYRLEDYEDYFYGYMVWNTSYLKYFDLCLYDEGFCCLLPEMDLPEMVPPFLPSRRCSGFSRNPSVGENRWKLTGWVI